VRRMPTSASTAGQLGARGLHYKPSQLINKPRTVVRPFPSSEYHWHLGGDWKNSMLSPPPVIYVVLAQHLHSLGPRPCFGHVECARGRVGLDDPFELEELRVVAYPPPQIRRVTKLGSIASQSMVWIPSSVSFCLQFGFTLSRDLGLRSGVGSCEVQQWRRRLWLGRRQCLAGEVGQVAQTVDPMTYDWD
jgi:hypothetical protein